VTLFKSKPVRRWIRSRRSRRRWHFIGPADLHASFGLVSERARPDIVPIIEMALRRIENAGRAPGFLIEEGAAQPWIDAGGQFVAVGSDGGIWLAAPKRWQPNSRLAAASSAEGIFHRDRRCTSTDVSARRRLGTH